MRTFLAFFAKCLAFTAILMGISWGIHTAMASYIAQKAEEAIQNLTKQHIYVSYESLKPENCLFKVCLSAQNVRVKLPNLTLPICLNHLIVKKGLFGSYTILANKDARDEKADNCAYIAGKITGTPDFWQVKKLAIKQNDLGGELSGEIDMIGQMIRLEGEAIGFADFAMQFIPANFQFLAQLVFSNKRQKIIVRTDESWIRIFDVPVLPKNIIFRGR